VAGNRDAATFTDGSIDIIYQQTKGIPRLINIMCDFLLLTAFVEETTEVDPTMVRDIVQDLDFETLYWGSHDNGVRKNIDYSALLHALGIQDPE
jgi:hypothetical protein